MRWAWVLPWLLFAGAAAAEEVPRLELANGEALVLSRLPPVLADQEVRRHLGSGLTTSFNFRLQVRAEDGTRLVGLARVDVRFEPWDEVYYLVAWSVDGTLARYTLSSFAALVEQWRLLQLTLLSEGEARAVRARPPGEKLRVELNVIPFSASEQKDTQRWFSDSIDRAGRGNAEEVTHGSDERQQALGEVFNLLMATSIQRRSLVSYRWQVGVMAGGGPP